jgi:hypothetical protein
MSHSDTPERLALLKAVEKARLDLVGYPHQGPYPEPLMVAFAEARTRLDLWDVRHPDRGAFP